MPSTAPRARTALRRAVASAITRGRYRRALDMINSNKGGTRRDPRLCLLKGRALARLYRSKDAMNAARRALWLDPNLTEARLLIADLQLSGGRLPTATRAFREILENGTRMQRARACGGLAICASEERCFDEARRWLQEGFKLRPQDPVLWCDRGDIERLADRPRAAGYAYRQALAARPRDIWARLGLARLDHDAGKLDRAWSQAQEAMAAAKEEIAAVMLCADIAMVRGAYNEAAQLFARVDKLSPSGDYSAETLYCRAEMLYRAGEHDQAAQAFRTFLKRYPQGQDAVAARRQLRLMAEHEGEPLPRVEIMPFPRLRQHWDFCGPATLAMVLRHWKLPGNQKKIGEDIWEEGTPLYRMSAYLKKCGLRVRTFRGSPDVVRALLRRKVPVILEVQTSPYGHFRIAVGFDELRDTVILQDPGFIEPVEMTWPQLEREWQDEGHWSLVAVPARQAHLLRGIHLPDQKLTALCDQVRSLMDRNRLKTARKRLSGHKADHPAAAMMLDRMRIQLEIQAQRLGRAGTLVRAATRRYSQAAWPWQMLADVCRLSGNLPRVRRALQAALRRAPQDYWTLLSLGRLELECDNGAEARQWFRRASRIDPDSSPAYEGLAIAYASDNQFMRALRAIQRARELSPNHAQLLQEEAYVLDRLGDLPAAEECLREALSINAADPWLQNELAYLLARRDRDLKAALKLARQSKRGGYQPLCDVEDTLGWVLFRLGRVSEAIKHLRTAERSARALRRNGRVEPEPLAEIRLHLGEALVEAGQERQAKRPLEQVADGETEFAPQATRLLRKLAT